MLCKELFPGLFLILMSCSLQGRWLFPKMLLWAAAAGLRMQTRHQGLPAEARVPSGQVFLVSGGRTTLACFALLTPFSWVLRSSCSTRKIKSGHQACSVAPCVPDTICFSSPCCHPPEDCAVAPIYWWGNRIFRIVY